jgi:hypothetical protein
VAAMSQPCLPDCQCRRHIAHVEKCPPGCTCRKHRRYSGSPRNVTAILNNPRERLQSTFGDEQRQRVTRATAERHAKGIPWRDTPSEKLNTEWWDRAIAGLYEMLGLT